MIMSILLRPQFCAVLVDLLPLLRLYIRALVNPVPILILAVVVFFLAYCFHYISVLVVAV